MTERTLILTKPDDVPRGLVGEAISRIEREGLKLVMLDLRVANEAIAKEHYAEHIDRPFFGELVGFITSVPLTVGVIEDPSAITTWRQLASGASPVEAAIPDSIHSDFALKAANNVAYGPNSLESVKCEIGIWFPNL